MFRAFKNLFKYFFQILAFIFKAIFAVLNFIILSLCSLIGFLCKKIRFSIIFKINFIYGLLYCSLFSLTFLIGISIFNKYLEKPQISPFSPRVTFYSLIFLLMFISLCVFLYFGKLIVNKIMKPLKDMTATVQAVSGNELKERLDTNGATDELKDLALTFNEMMDRLQVFVERQQQFVSDASHELRTPIAVIQGYANMLDRWAAEDPNVLLESIESIKDETASMKDLVEKLLFLARSDKNTLKVEKQLMNLSDITLQVLKEIRFIDDEHEFISRIDSDIMILGDIHLIKELIRIFVDNAIKYTPEGGQITLSCLQTTKHIMLSIKDTGIGISKQHIHSLFDRFYRVDEARSKHTGGTGLGLAIAKQICTTHEAEIFVNSTLGQGSEFIIFFKPLTSQ